MKRHMLVFSDLDGTLLDHETYSFAPAQPLIQQLSRLGIPLILNSSKTRSEIADLRCAMANSHPYVVENGAAVVVPAGYFPHFKTEHIEYFGPDTPGLLNQLHRIRSQFGFRFTGFSDYSPKDLADLTGLSLENAIRAKQRIGSEPIEWRDNEDSWAVFCSEIAKTELVLVRGGRFIHVMGKTDKGKGVLWLIEQYRQAYPEKQFISVGLGDSPNDYAMLANVDIPVIIPNPLGGGLDIERHTVIRPFATGSAGWAEAIQQIIEQSEV